MREPYRIEAIALHQVGVFADLELRFPPIATAQEDAVKAEIHLFTGPNGCGKSTLLYALAEIFDSLTSSGLIQRRFHGPESNVDFLFAGQSGHYGVIKPDGKPDGQIDNRYAAYSTIWDQPDKGMFFGYGLGRDQYLTKYKQLHSQFQAQNALSQSRFPFAAFAYSGQRTVGDIKLAAIQQITNSPFQFALSFDGSTRPQILLQWIANNRTQSALARQDGDSDAAAVYDLALSRITNLIKDICDLDLEFRLERSPLAVAVRLNGENIRFDGLPDGLKSIITWVADLSLRLEAIPWQVEQDIFSQPIILFLDEVDIHLHPKWQRRILPAIQRLLPNAQVFVSTHSPFVVGSVEDAWVYVLPEPVAGGTSGVVEAIPSGAGKSYRLILEEVFGLSGEFDVETEALFSDFYQLREQFLKVPGNPDALLTAARALAARGEEATLIVSRELRQISRVTRHEVSLA